MSSVKSPPIGWRLLWYPHADTKSKPTVADVTDVHPNGCVDLSLVPPRGGECSHVRGVRHVDDPELEKHPNIRVKFGGWDWVPGLVPPDSPNDTAESQHVDIPEDVTERIFEMHTNGDSAAEIAKKLRLKGVTAARVQQVVDSLVAN